jgi:hypothetical protein
MLRAISTYNGVGFSAERSFGGDIPIWIDPKELGIEPGGFSIQNTPAAEAIIPAGTPIFISESARTAYVCFRFEVYENATDSAVAIKIVKDNTKFGNLAKVAMNIMKQQATLAGTAAAYPIASIDTTNALYDVITLTTTLGVSLTAGDILAEADGTATSGRALRYTANGLTKTGVLVEDDNLKYNCSSVYKGAIYNRRIRKIAAIERAALPQIHFSESK